MHYNNSTGKDGVFVVEVSRGVDSQHIPESLLGETATTFIQTLKITSEAKALTTKPNLLMEKNEKCPTMKEEVQVHEPPRDMEETKKLNEIPEVEEEQTDIQRSNTGLSQSDLSSTSSSNSNTVYTYGNQTLYNEDPSLIAKIDSKCIKLQYETNSIKIAAEDDQNKTNKSSAKFDEMEIQSNETEEKQQKTNANEAIEMDNKLQMQVTSEPAINAVVEQKDVADNEQNLEINNTCENVTQSALPVKKVEGEEKILKQQEIIENNIEKCINNAHGNEIAVETVFDSLMSLPEPPSYEEIKQISGNIGGENTQLDSLPPPPLFFGAQEQSIEFKSGSNDDLFKDELQQHNLNNIKIVPPPSSTTTDFELNNGKQLLSTQLTPPESPPGVNNRGTAAICLPLSAMAVNVNGS